MTCRARVGILCYAWLMVLRRCMIDSRPRKFHNAAYGLLVNLADLVVRNVERDRFFQAESHRKEHTVAKAIRYACREEAYSPVVLR